MSALVRIPDETKAKLDRLAEQTQQTRAALIVDALSALEERWFWKAFHTGYENIAQDPQRWEALGSAEDGTGKRDRSSQRRPGVTSPRPPTW
jgi:hypothetical protein